MAHQHHMGPRRSRSSFGRSSRRDEARTPKQPHSIPRRSRSPSPHSSRHDKARGRRAKQPYTGPRRSHSPSPHSSRRDETRRPKQPYTGPRRARSPSPHRSRRHETRTPKQPHSRPRRSRSPFGRSSRRDETRRPKQPHSSPRRSRSPPPLTRERSSATESAIQSIACVSVHNVTADELRTRGTAWVVGPDLLVTSFHTLSHDHHTVRELYISHPLDPSMKLFGLEIVGASKFLDLALLRCTETTFHRVAVEELVEPYEKIYHVESLDIDYPVVHTSTFVPSGNDLSAHSVGPYDTGFSGGPVMNRRGRCVEVFKGAYSPNELTKKVFVTTYALRLFLEQVASEINPDLRYFEAMRAKKWFSLPQMAKETKARGGVVVDSVRYWGEGTAETVPDSSLDCTWAKKTVITDSRRW